MTVLGPSYIRSHKLLSAIVTLPENISVQVYNMCTLENLENSSYVALIVGTRPDFRDFFLKKKKISFFLWQLDRLENCLMWLMIAYSHKHQCH